MADNLKVMKRCPDCGTLNDDDSLFCMKCRCDLSSVMPESIDDDVDNNKVNLERPNTDMYEGIIPPIRETESSTEPLTHTTSTIPVIPPVNDSEPKKDYKKYYIWGSVAALLLVAGLGLMLFMNRGESQVSAYDAHITQGQKYVAEKKYDAAVDEFEQAKKLDPKKEEAYENLYYTYEKQGDLKQQQQVYQQYNTETGKTQKDMQAAQKEIYIIIVEKDSVDPKPVEPEEPEKPVTYDEAAPILEQWENVTDWNSFETSKEYTYEIRWSAVNEAEGYEFNYAVDKDTDTILTEEVKDTKFSVKFKDSAALIAKVRAYKTVDGQRLYTPWSDIQSKDKKVVEQECVDLNPNIELAPVQIETPEDTKPSKEDNTNQAEQKTEEENQTNQAEGNTDPTANSQEDSKEETVDQPEENPVEEPVIEEPKELTVLDLLNEIHNVYVFTDGGTWSTLIEIDNEGILHGHYLDEVFEEKEDYQLLRHECFFTGKIKNIKKVKDGVYTADFVEYENISTPGEQIIDENSTTVKQINVEKAYGFENCKTITFYVPGTPITEFSDKQREYLPDESMLEDLGWMLNNEDNYLMWGTME